MSMEKTAPIVVRAVGNGWMVTPLPAMARGEFISDSETLVFETLNGLQPWMQQHYAREAAE